MKGIIRIAKDGEDWLYEFREIACEIGGRGFAVRRLDQQNVYHVRIGPSPHLSCECLGYLAHGNCKHLRGLRAIFEGTGATGDVTAVLVQ